MLRGGWRDGILMDALPGESWPNQSLKGVEMSMVADEDGDIAHGFL